MAEEETLMIETAPHFVINLTLQSIGSIFCIILLVIHSFKCSKNLITKKSHGSKKKEPLPLFISTNVVTIMMIISFNLAIISSALFTIIYLINDEIYAVCGFHVLRLHCCGYTFGKGCMYLIFVMRMYSVYNNTVYKVNEWILKISAIYVITSMITFTVLGGVTIFPIEYIFELNREIVFCNGAIPLYVGALFVMNDMFITLVTLYIFISPMLKMIKQLDNGSCPSATNKFRFAAKKVTILTLTAVCSTCIGMTFLMLTGSNALLWVDCVINCSCVMLMTPYYAGMYNKICCGLIKCVDICSRKSNNPDDTVESKSTQQIESQENTQTMTTNETEKQQILQITSNQAAEPDFRD